MNNNYIKDLFVEVAAALQSDAPLWKRGVAILAVLMVLFTLVGVASWWAAGWYGAITGTDTGRAERMGASTIVAGGIGSFITIAALVITSVDNY